MISDPGDTMAGYYPMLPTLEAALAFSENLVKTKRARTCYVDGYLNGERVVKTVDRNGVH